MGHMLKAARHDAIVELLRDRPAMRTVDVARNLNVSMATARRDCIALEVVSYTHLTLPTILLV